MTYLSAQDISKTYPGGVVANSGVCLNVQAGLVHAVVGENGAGKSTLMKVLYGIEQPDSGQLCINNQAVTFSNSRQAIAAGIGMVFQHFSLVPSFSVYQNVILGAEPVLGLKLQREQAIARVAELSERFKLHVDPLAVTRELPVGQQQRVEILKVLYRNAQILILDEPTAVLAPQEVVELFAAIRWLVKQGRTVIFIAHKLPEVLEISDQITVMRAGKSVAEVNTKEASEQRLAQLMVGREVNLRVQRKPVSGSPVLTVKRLSVPDGFGRQSCAAVNLTVRAGEIVGLVGVEGNGQAELMAAIAGLSKVKEGSIRLHDHDITHLRVAQRRAKGMAIIPEDRLAEGLAVGSSIAENLAATRLNTRAFVSRGLLRLAAIKAQARQQIARFSIKATGSDVDVGTLSGGNMQKVVIARELAERPALLLVSQPTRGVDLGATQFVWQTLTQTRDQGTAIVLSSADLAELLALSDRLLVFYQGRISAAFVNNDSLTPETLGTYMLGLAQQPPAEMARALV